MDLSFCYGLSLLPTKMPTLVLSQSSFLVGLVWFGSGLDYEILVRCADALMMFKC